MGSCRFCTSEQLMQESQCPERPVRVQADALEHALMAALPLGPQSAAGGVSLPDSFAGELQVGLPLPVTAEHLHVHAWPCTDTEQQAQLLPDEDATGWLLPGCDCAAADRV